MGTVNMWKRNAESITRQHDGRASDFAARNRIAILDLFSLEEQVCKSVCAELALMAARARRYKCVCRCELVSDREQNGSNVSNL